MYAQLILCLIVTTNLARLCVK